MILPTSSQQEQRRTHDSALKRDRKTAQHRISIPSRTSANDVFTRPSYLLNCGYGDRIASTTTQPKEDICFVPIAEPKSLMAPGSVPTAAARLPRLRQLLPRPSRLCRPLPSRHQLPIRLCRPLPSRHQLPIRLCRPLPIRLCRPLPSRSCLPRPSRSCLPRPSRSCRPLPSRHSHPSRLRLPLPRLPHPCLPHPLPSRPQHPFPRP